MLLLSLLQKSLKQEYFLWQLFNIEKDVAKANEELDAEEAVVKEIVEKLGEYESASSSQKKELSGYMKEIAMYERKIADRKNKLDKNVNSSTLLILLLQLLLCLLLLPCHVCLGVEASSYISSFCA